MGRNKRVVISAFGNVNNDKLFEQYKIQNLFISWKFYFFVDMAAISDNFFHVNFNLKLWKNRTNVKVNRTNVKVLNMYLIMLIYDHVY